MASLVSIQYGLLVNLKYFRIIKPFFINNSYAEKVSAPELFFEVLIFMSASFAVAWLASILSVQLRSARADLKEMDEYVKRVKRLAYAGEIAAGFAHEVKNPMASLRGSIQLLLSDIKKGRKKDVDKLGEIVLRESDRLDQLVNNFLYFARPVQGDKKRLNPCSEINQLLKIFRQDSRFLNSIELITDFDYKGQIEIDPDHFRQIIWNILINALESTPSGGKIFIGIKEKNNKSEIVIQDNGDGISQEITEKIFDPFFSTKKKGSGLGLSIVARLVETYDGTLYIKSDGVNTGVKVVIIFNSL